MPRGIEKEKYDSKKLLQAISNRNHARVKQLILAGTPTFIDSKQVLDQLDVEDELFLLQVISNLQIFRERVKTQRKPGNERLLLSEFLSHLTHHTLLHKSELTNRPAKHDVISNPSIQQLHADRGIRPVG